MQVERLRSDKIVAAQDYLPTASPGWADRHLRDPPLCASALADPRLSHRLTAPARRPLAAGQATCSCLSGIGPSFRPEFQAAGRVSPQAGAGVDVRSGAVGVVVLAAELRQLGRGGRVDRAADEGERGHQPGRALGSCLPESPTRVMPGSLLIALPPDSVPQRGREKPGVPQDPPLQQQLERLDS